MASINQLVSEIANSIQQPDSVPVRQAILLSIIHARNELIRKTYFNNKTIDRVLQQRFIATIIDVPDGDLPNTSNLQLKTIKRTKFKVPRPVRFSNGIPFNSVRTLGVASPIEIPYNNQANSIYYNFLPGMQCITDYDYINEYIYINIKNDRFNTISKIVIEGVFEKPHLIETITNESTMNDKDNILTEDEVDYDNEFLLPEDMVETLKKTILSTFNPEIVRQTNEIPTQNLIK